MYCQKAFLIKNRAKYSVCSTILFCCLLTCGIAAQEKKTLLLTDAVTQGLSSYQGLKAKRNYLNASAELVQDAKNRYLPNIIAAVQQNYGTVNGQYGPLFAAEGMGIASAGPISGAQRWDAAFGGLYLVNANWEFFTFGRVRSRIDLANATVRKDSADLQQEEFIQSIKVSGTYLNLLAAQALIANTQANLARAISIQQSVLARTRSGLIAGVDSSIANAEVSRAKLAIIEAVNNEQQISNQLSQLLNITDHQFILDTGYLHKIPAGFATQATVDNNPQVKYFQSRIDESIFTADFLKKSILPGVNLFGVMQTRGSGFNSSYTAANNFPYSSKYWEGIKPARHNFITGVSFAWNILSPIKIKQQVKAQQYITDAYKNEYEQVTTELKNQLILADNRIKNSLDIIREVPKQYKAAADAYLQKSVLYKNGLTDIIDLQQALYLVNRAQTDISVANINVWQALLLKAAASGDFELFRSQVQ